MRRVLNGSLTIGTGSNAACCRGSDVWDVSKASAASAEAGGVVDTEGGAGRVSPASCNRLAGNGLLVALVVAAANKGGGFSLAA